MNSRRHLGLVGGAATLLSTAPLWVIFTKNTWLIQCVVAVALITGTAILARTLRAPVWAQLVAMSAVLTFTLTWFHPSHRELLGLVPTPDTFAYFGELLKQAVDDMRSYGVPVPDRPALLFLTVLGVGAVAIVVDLVTVSLRRPALAGLPMLAIYSVPVTIYTDSVPTLPFAIGASGFLWLLVADNVERVRRFGRRFSGDGRGIDTWAPSPIAAAGRRLAVVGVLAAMALPLAMPDLGGGLANSFGSAAGGDGAGNGSGKGTGTVDLFAELSGRLNQSDTQQLVKVTTNEPDPYYLRFAVADQIDKSGFRNRPPTGRSIRWGLSEPRAVPGITYRRFRAKIETTNRFDMPLLPAYTQPVGVDGLDTSWYLDVNAQIIYSNRSRSTNKTYEIEYLRPTYDPQALRRATSLPPTSALRRDFANAPVIPAVSARVNQLIRGKTTDYDKVRAIYDSLSARHGFTYSLSTKPGTSGNSIVDFLENKTGFCEQYAAALAWMVRVAGIPSRVAFGFTNGSARNGNTYILTNRNLHAWTEVYFAGFGWVPFDATPSASVPGSVASSWAPDTNRRPDAGPSAGTANAAENESNANAPGRNPDKLANDPGAPGGTAAAAGGSPWRWWMLGWLAFLLLGAPALWRSRLRRRRHARPVPETATTAAVDNGSPGEAVVIGPAGGDIIRSYAHAAWDELIDTLVDFRVPVDVAETPRATTERIIQHASLDSTASRAVQLLGLAEERARYAREPMRTPGLADALHTVRRALARHANRRERVTALVMPPSVLLRWWSAVADSFAHAVLTAGTLRDRFTPRRLRRPLSRSTPS